MEFNPSNKEMRDNYLKAIEFRYPEWIPCAVGFSPITCKVHGKKLEEIRHRHPLVFRYDIMPFLSDQKPATRDADFPPGYRAGEYYTDNWGCTWYNIQEGMEGQVVSSPLSDWKAFETYHPPDFLVKSERRERNWEQIKNDIEERRSKGLLTIGDGERLFDRLYFLRGFENLMIDIVTDNPNLPRLIKMLEEYETKLVKKWLEIGVDIISFHTDIGTQHGLMISPAKFRKYIKPLYKNLFTMCRKAGTHVYLSSDGRLLDIVDDLIECGVSVHDPQLRANTLEGIAKAYKGKMCIDLDLDRQMFAFCTPAQIRRQVKEAVEKLYLPEGGLMMKAEFNGPNIPLDNIEAMCRAMEQFCIGKK
ncbi:MAG: uroporphyrinogen decarboxylase family protein [Candidatus Bathyarchaeia archaeon]